MSNLKDNLTAEEWQQLEKKIEEEKESLAASARAATLELKEMNETLSQAYFKAISGAPVPSLIKSIKGLIARVESGQVDQAHFYENLKAYIKKVEKIFGYEKITWYLAVAFCLK